MGVLLPAFSFDGREKPLIKVSEKSLSVTYRNWVCRWQLKAGKIVDTGKKGYNRNGHYKLFRAENKDELTLLVSISPVK